jgi:hypothetical protein
VKTIWAELVVWAPAPAEYSTGRVEPVNTTADPSARGLGLRDGLRELVVDETADRVDAPLVAAFERRGVVLAG